MYNILLTIGKQVSIYTDFKEEIGYEGEAILIEKLAIGDTFFLSDEYVASNPGMSSKPNKLKEANNAKLNEVFTKLKEQTKDAQKFFRDILKLRSNKINDYNNMLKFVFREKDLAHKKYLSGSYDNDDRFKRILREINSDYIVRYFQQFNKKINNSVFKYEKWKVEFIIDNHGNLINHVAIKKIRVLIKNNYREKNGYSDLSLLTTYNGKALKRINKDELLPNKEKN
jgi:hypothetical protein